MGNKNITFIPAILLAVFLTSQANAEEPRFTLSSKWLSKYVGPQGTVWHKDPVIQTKFEVPLPEGFSYKIWHSAGTNDSSLSSDGADEIDHTLRWRKANWLGVPDLNVDMGITYFDTADLFDVPRGDIINPYLEVSKGFRISKNNRLAPYLKFSPYFPAKGNSPEKGLYVLGGFRHAWQINPKLALNHKLGAIYDDGVLAYDSGFIGEYRLDLSWKLSKTLTLNLPSLMVFTPLTSLSDDRKTEVVLGGGLKYSF